MRQLAVSALAVSGPTSAIGSRVDACTWCAGTVVAKPEPSDGGYLAPGTAPMASDASMGAAEGSTGAGGVSVSAAPSQSAAPSHDKVKKEKKEKKHKVCY